MNYEIETQFRPSLIDPNNDHNQFIIFYDSDAMRQMKSTDTDRHTHAPHSSERLEIHCA